VRRAAWTLGVLAALAMPVAAKPAANKPTPKADAAVEAQLRKLDEAWSEALSKRDNDAALVAAKKAYELQVKATGKDSEAAERRKSTLASALLEAGQLGPAEKLYLEIITTGGKQKPTTSQEITGPLEDLIRIYQAQARYDETEPLWSRILTVSKRIDGEKSEQYGRQLQAYAWMLQSRNDDAAAIRPYEQARAVFEAVAKTKAHP